MSAQHKLDGEPMPMTDAVVTDETLPEMFWRRAQGRAEKTIFREKKLGVWNSIRWREAGDAVRAVACALMADGFVPGDVACILSNNRVEWLYADLGCMAAGGISAGIYPTVPLLQVRSLLADSKCRVIFVENEEQLDKVLSVREHATALERIVVYDTAGLRSFKDPMVISFQDFLEHGRIFDRAQPRAFEQRLGARRSGDAAIIIYTSGTTGLARGARISHQNLMVQMAGGVQLTGQTERDERLSFLPMCHAAERVVGIYYALYSGTITNFVEKPDTFAENACEVAPTIFMGVPRVWEKLHAGIMLRLSDATPFQRFAYRAAMAIGHMHAAHRLAGRKTPLWLWAPWFLAYLLVLKNIRRMIGVDRCRILITGAAPTSPDLIRWYLALGLNMLECYGQTECSGLITLTPLDVPRLGSCGRVAPFCDVEIASDGEILVRGPSVFLGYLNDTERSGEVLRGGLLHTGDAGALDADGFLTITGRIKDIFITSGGKNVAPAAIENEIKFSPYIADAVVIGDGRKYLTCLVMIDQENVVHFAQQEGVSFTDFTSLCRSERIQDLIRDEIETVNRKLAQVETIKKFRLIERQLTSEDKEMTPTMKLKRKTVAEQYAELIESMYRDE